MNKRLLLVPALLLSVSAAFAQTTQPATAPTTKPSSSMPMTGKSMMSLNVNTATEAQLAALPGVGPKLASAMVAARPFKNKADLIKRVKGIGKKNYVKLGLDKALTF